MNIVAYINVPYPKIYNVNNTGSLLFAWCLRYVHWLFDIQARSSILVSKTSCSSRNLIRIYVSDIWMPNMETVQPEALTAMCAHFLCVHPFPPQLEQQVLKKIWCSSHRSSSSRESMPLPRPTYEHKQIRLHLRPRKITSGYGQKWWSPFSTLTGRSSVWLRSAKGKG